MRGALAIVCACAAALLAQQPQQPPAAQQPTFTSGTQVVQVDARVFDKGGHFVADLKPEDFEVKEDGVPQHVVSLALVRTPTASAALAPSAPAPSASLAPPAPLAPSAPSVWVFVFDTGHLSQGGIERTRKAVVQFLQDKFREGDIGGIVAGGKMANNRLTSVRPELVKAANDIRLPDAMFRYQNEMTREWPKILDEFEAWQIAVRNDSDALQRAVIRACTEDPDACRSTPPDGAIRIKCQRIIDEAHTATANALRSVEALSNGLARMPGPKTIVFLSEGFVILDMEEALRDATALANRAGAHFYTIDARGLNKGRGSSIIDQKTSVDTAGAFSTFDMQEDGTNALAVDTGGIAIRNENNFGRALDEIQQDAATYYVVGYTPANHTFDGKFRKIDVSVKRADVKVRARRGYLALEPALLLKPTPIATPPPTTPNAAKPEDKTAAPAPPAPAPATSAPATPAPAPADASTAPSTAAAEALRTSIDSHGLVQLLKDTKEPKDAKDVGVRLSPADGDDLAGKGWQAYQQGDLEHAAVYLGQAAQSPDAHPWVPYALGLADLALAKYPEAVQNWERVRKDVPTFEPVYFNLADGYMLQHDDDSALKVLRDAQGRFPKDSDVWNATGVLDIRRTALDAAVDAFRRATQAAPNDSLGYFNLARAYQMRGQQSVRYSSTTSKWVGGNQDFQNAVNNYQKYISMGGPYVQQAKQALQVLNWK